MLYYIMQYVHVHDHLVIFLLLFSVTVDGLERHFAVNHLGHFYLARLLLPVLKKSKPSRVVVITSESHWWVLYNKLLDKVCFPVFRVVVLCLFPYSLLCVVCIV